MVMSKVEVDFSLDSKQADELRDHVNRVNCAIRQDFVEGGSVEVSLEYPKEKISPKVLQALKNQLESAEPKWKVKVFERQNKATACSPGDKILWIELS